VLREALPYLALASAITVVPSAAIDEAIVVITASPFAFTCPCLGLGWGHVGPPGTVPHPFQGPYRASAGS